MREAILQAALLVFQAKGYHAARMSDVATEAGLAKGTLYLYFASKEEMTAALAEGYFREIELRFMPEQPAESLDEFIEGLRTALSFGEEEARSIPVFFEVFGPSFTTDAFSQQVSKFFETLGECYGEHLSHLQTKGALSKQHNPSQLGRALAAMLDGLVLHRGLFGVPTERYVAMVDSALLLFRAGLSPAHD
nr:TetR/AcrR family transcriptional regulator [Pseudovibrio flavus]